MIGNKTTTVCYLKELWVTTISYVLFRSTFTHLVKVHVFMIYLP